MADASPALENLDLPLATTTPRRPKVSSKLRSLVRRLRTRASKTSKSLRTKLAREKAKIGTKKSSKAALKAAQRAERAAAAEEKQASRAKVEAQHALFEELILDRMRAEVAEKKARKEAKRKKRRSLEKSKGKKSLSMEASKVEEENASGLAAPRPSGEVGGEKKDEEDGHVVKAMYDRGKKRVEGVLDKLKPSNWLKLRVKIDDPAKTAADATGGVGGGDASATGKTA